LEPLERQGDVEKAYGRSLEVLGGLKSGLPATAARLERARKAAEHVEEGTVRRSRLDRTGVTELGV
jgi:hypothetical protein